MGSSAIAAEIASLNEVQNVHAIAVSENDPGKLLLATHQGLFLAGPDGPVTQLSKDADDFEGFSVHPTNPDIFLSSGHLAKGGNLGIIRSDDSGRNWERLAEDSNGSRDFHAMAISRIDPNVVFGINRALQVSRDGGRSWKTGGKLPGETFDFAASAQDMGTLYAATRQGLYVSRDGGKTWSLGYLVRQPTTMVHAAADGSLYAFIYGVGLVSAKEPNLEWKTVSNDFNDRFLVDLKVDPSFPGRLYGVADTGAVMASKDGGRTWTSFEGSQRATPKVIARGRKLFEETCQTCHGIRGVGERPEDMYAKDEFGFVAPPLDDSAHGWHHSDQGLVETILTGSPRNERMIGQKDNLSREEAKDIVTYIKSLWSFRSLACQGSRHMNCK